MSVPKDPIKYVEYIQKLRDSHIGKEPGNKGKPSPKKGKTYAEIGRGPSPLTGIPRPESFRKKLSEGQRRRWGRDPSPERDGELSRVWAKAVKKRDNYTCQGCGIRQRDLPKTGNSVRDYLHAHHIKSWREFPNLRFDVTNGISYCHPCHWKAENFQLTVPDSMPPPAKKQRVAWNKGKKTKATYVRTKEQKLESKVYHLLLKALGKTYRGRRPKGIPAWNKGKNLLEIHGLGKAAEISKKYADAARRTKNRLGTGKAA